MDRALRRGRSDVRRPRRIQVVGVNSTPRLRSDALERGGRDAPNGPRRRAARVRAPPRPAAGPRPQAARWRPDQPGRATLLALLCDLEVDVVLHGHIHRAHCWQVSDGRMPLVVASAGALVNDGRRDASFLELLADDGRLAVWRRSVAHGAPIMLYEGTRNVRA